jgi:putative oxidoreductase
MEAGGAFERAKDAENILALLGPSTRRVNVAIGSPMSSNRTEGKQTLQGDGIMFTKLVSTTNDSTQTMLRVVLGLVFFAHGAQMVPGWFGGLGFTGTMGTFEQMGIPAALAILAIAAQFFGGIGLLLGFLGRAAAFGVLVSMVVAILMVHRQFGLFMNWTGSQKGEGFEFHLLAIAMALAVVVKGSGAFSLDRFLTTHSLSRRASRLAAS